MTIESQERQTNGRTERQTHEDVFVKVDEFNSMESEELGRQEKKSTNIAKTLGRQSVS